MTQTLDEPAHKPGWSAKLIHAASGAYRAVLRSVFPTERDAWLVRAQFELYGSSTKYNGILLALAAYLVALAVSPWVSFGRRTAWWIAVAIISIAVNLAGHWLERKLDSGLSAFRLRAQCFVALSLIFFAAWCSMGVVLWVPGAPIDHMMLVLLLACSLAGSIAITAVHPGIALAAFVAHAVFLIVPTAASGTPLDTKLAELAGLFVLLIAAQFVALNTRMTRMLRLEHERAGLVNDLRAAKEESDRERERAATAALAKSQFLSHMNHELRTPMNAILGFSEMIQNKAFDAAVDKYAEYAGIIHDSGVNLLALINDMIDLSKIEGGKPFLREAEVDLAHIVAEEVHQNRPSAERQDISLGCSMHCALPRVLADERGIRQIVSNLLSNALKFTQPGGEIAVFAHLNPDGRLSFGVEDNGIGMSAKDLVDAFDRFGRGRHDVTMADRGIGLGLAIVKGFAEAHGGEVTLESRLGSGTRVTVFLPAARVLVSTRRQTAA